MNHLIYFSFFIFLFCGQGCSDQNNSSLKDSCNKDSLVKVTTEIGKDSLMKSSNETGSKDSLVKILKKTNNDELFNSGRFNNVDSIWQNGNAENLLGAIVKDSSYDFNVRFLASEVLFEKLPGYPPKGWEKIIAEIYTQALKGTAGIVKQRQFILSGNSWGSLTLFKTGTPGKLGSHLLTAGETAVPFLLKLLDDTDIVYYEGSREATMENSYQYRIKDFAAYYIATIRNIPMPFHRENKERDAEIERLKSQLSK